MLLRLVPYFQMVSPSDESVGPVGLAALWLGDRVGLAPFASLVLMGGVGGLAYGIHSLAMDGVAGEEDAGGAG